MTEENSLLNYDVGDSIDFEPVPADTEAKVRIRSADRKHAEEGRIQIILELLEFPNADDVFYTLWVPRKDDDEKQRRRTSIGLRKFYRAFGIDYSQPVNINQDVIGATAWAILTTEEWEGVPRNKIKTFIAEK